MFLSELLAYDRQEMSSLPSTNTGNGNDARSGLNFDLDQVFDLELYSDLSNFDASEFSKETKAMIDPDDLSLTEYLLQFGNAGSDTDSDSLSWLEQQVSNPSPSHLSPTPTNDSSHVLTKQSENVAPKVEYESSPEVMEGKNRRNAIMAKQNREKKKKYVSELEDTVEELKKENASLQRNMEQMKKTFEDMMTEIGYLKGVIANQSELSSLLKHIGSVPGVQFVSSSLLQSGEEQGNSTCMKRKQESGGKNNCVSGKKRKTGNLPSAVKEAGVCLHVRSGKVSLEFCADCNKKANNAEAVAEEAK